MKRVFVERLLSLIVLSFIIVNLALIVAILFGRVELRSVKAQYGRRTDGQQPPQLDGFARDGSPVELAHANSGYAVWYGSHNCPFCRREEEWGRLSLKLQQKGLRVLVLLPGAGDEFPGDRLKPKDALQIAYASADWLKQYPLFVTPTLLIFDANKQLIWHHRGMLDADKAADALRAVDGTNRSR